MTSLSSCQRKDDEIKWWRGNMHTHTFWSDGDDFPESVAQWYKDNGYDFFVFTDHNIILEGERWRKFKDDHHALEKYKGLFGEDWVETRPDDEEGYLQVRLRPLDEFRDMFEEPEKFMLMMGNEITNQHSVHILAFHQDEIIPTTPGTAEERAMIIRETVRKVDEYRERTGRNTYPALAHPNFRWAITAEMMIEAENLSFFEVYNGHPAVNNEGDEFRASTERMWDIVLANRLEEGKKLLYGLATDDAHNYHAAGATPGRGWVMVRSENLTPESILDAISKGDFYSSTGVAVRDITYNGKQIHIEIEPQEGVEYLTEYIVTSSGYDAMSMMALDESDSEILNTTRIYSGDIGTVVASSNEIHSSYTMRGDELYVRVRITSSADQKDRITGEIIGKQMAWVQPVVPGVAMAHGH
jgi:hypothetical protein